MRKSPSLHVTVSTQLPVDVVQRLDKVVAVAPARSRLTRALLIRMSIVPVIEQLEMKLADELAAYDREQAKQEEKSDEALLEAVG